MVRFIQVLYDLIRQHTMMVLVMIVAGLPVMASLSCCPETARGQHVPPQLETTPIQMISTQTGQTRTGLDNLIAANWAQLRGKRVGLITNQSGITRSGQLGADAFAHAKACTLVALFAPEHGLHGTRQAGVTSDSQETFDGVPVYSLYGSTRQPTKAMLRGVTALVFDIQDVGVRPYTYLSTMLLAMTAAAGQHIPMYVLDRPNPLSGNRIEGNIIATGLLSFVGQAPVPYLHGMTLGELAKMANAKGWVPGGAAVDLTVIPMTGWRRSYYWDQTGLTWTPPSPNVPQFKNAVGLAMLGATGELGILSVGVGTDDPFLRIGSSLVTSAGLARLTDTLWRAPRTLQGNSTDGNDSPGAPFLVRPEEFTASTSAGTKTYHGVHLTLPTFSDKAILKNDPSRIPELYAPQFRLLQGLLLDTLFRSSFDRLPASVQTMFEKVTGTYGLMDSLRRGADLGPIFQRWRQDADAFRTARAPYLLYR